MLSTRDVPQAYVEDRAIKEVDKPKILGLAVGTTVQAQQTLMWTDLATANEERRDLSALIVPGSRAVSIKTRREDASAAMVKPGDYVDVIAVLPDPNQAQLVRRARRRRLAPEDPRPRVRLRDVARRGRPRREGSQRQRSGPHAQHEDRAGAGDRRRDGEGRSSTSSSATRTTTCARTISRSTARPS